MSTRPTPAVTSDVAVAAPAAHDHPRADGDEIRKMRAAYSEAAARVLAQASTTTL